MASHTEFWTMPFYLSHAMEKEARALDAGTRKHSVFSILKFQPAVANQLASVPFPSSSASTRERAVLSWSAQLHAQQQMESEVLAEICSSEDGKAWRAHVLSESILVTMPASHTIRKANSILRQT
eukprot:scaffold83801_cov17-Tisochrysis_lutea.AAC.2